MTILQSMGINKSQEWASDRMKIIRPIVEDNVVNVVEWSCNYVHDFYKVTIPEIEKLMEDHSELVLRIAEFVMIVGVLHGINAMEKNEK